MATNTTFIDDRTVNQKKTHRILIGGTDAFMSGWGHAKGRASYAFWACKPEHAAKVKRWVRNRGDIKRVREVGSDYKPRGNVHCHVYAVTDNHPALR